MKTWIVRHSVWPAVAALLLACLTASVPARAELADIADVPLANSPSDAVLPNLTYILDDSGSMAWDYMPDNVFDLADGTSINNGKTCNSSSCTTAGNQLQRGEPPYYASQFNQIYYNPDITYAPGVDYLGVSLGSQGAPWTAVRSDPYTNTLTTNLVANYREIVYCNKTSPSAADLVNSNGSNDCKRNGIDNGSFLYWGTSGADVGYPVRTNNTSTTYRYAHTLNTSPYYFTITPVEYCSDQNLSVCTLATAPTGAFTIPAPIRYCRTTADAAATAAVSGVNGSSQLKCQKKFDQTNYRYPRYGRFTRTNIVPATATYPKSATARRADCANAAHCTYAEEMTNFANWYAYYRTRLQMMKTSTGRAFVPIDDRYRVGFITINPNSPVTASKYLKIDTFTSTQKSAWYTKLYGQFVNGSTPLREALSRVGRHYAGIITGINDGMLEDPVTHSCQQNFALLTTDGYWNGNSGRKIDNTLIGNQDNANSGYTTRSAGSYDGGLAGASDTLADVAAYYYKTDLRTAGSKATNNVPTSSKDSATHQHMTTFTLGLGLQGLMDYVPDYDTSPTSDYAKIKSASTGCSWATGTCNWPVPAAGQPSALDDLWHAAANGRGTYFSAADPNSLADGMASALAALQLQAGAAAASATSSPNITESDNFIYSTTFRTVKWDGDVVAQRIDTSTGAVLPVIIWSAQTLLDARVSPAADTRTVHTFDSGSATKLKPFEWANLTAAAVGSIAPERPYFTNKCTSLSQCALLSVADQAAANTGSNMVEYLRGRSQHEGTIYRDREHVLGDPVNATPAYVKAPRYNFQDVVTPDYAAFKLANASRQGVLYVPSNDGMVHAFNGDTGQEMWAYVPRILFPKLHKLATDNWDVRHEYMDDGSPHVMDAFIDGAWKTILVGGLNKGGRGYYALDVTDPNNPKGMWEFCSDSTLCEVTDSDLGNTYGNPIITKRKFDGKWVVLVTSGMNNVTPGNGKGYLYVLDLKTGAVLRKVTTNAGDTTTPGGLNRIAAYSPSFNTDNTSHTVYGGDLLGNLWRYDLSVDPPTVIKMAELKDGAGKAQSVTTRPELALIDNNVVVYVGTGRYLGTNDLQDPATLTPALPWAYQQSLYGIKDIGASHGNARASANLVEQQLVDSGGTTRTTTNNPVDWTAKNGWYIDFNPGGTSPGERVNLDPQLILGTLVVVSNVPNQNACTVGGDSWIYQFDYKKGGFVASSANQVAGRKTTGRTIVGNVVFRLPNRTFRNVATCSTGCKDESPVDVGGAGGIARRISWRELVK